MNFSFQWVCFSTRFPLLTFSMIRYCLHTFFQFFKHDFSSFNILIIPTLKILPNGSNIWAHAKAVSHPCFFLPTNGLHFPVLFPCLHNFWWKLNMLIFYINSGYWSSKHRLGLLVYFSLWYKVDSSSNAWWQPVTSLPQRLSLGHTHSHPRMRVVLARLSVFHFFVKQSALGGITPSSKSPVIAPWGINYLGGGTFNFKPPSSCNFYKKTWGFFLSQERALPSSPFLTCLPPTSPLFLTLSGGVTSPTLCSK